MESNRNILFLDAYKAHAVYGKKLLKLPLGEKGFKLFVKYDFRNIQRFVVEHEIDTVVLFLYGSNHIHYLLPFESLGLHVVACTTGGDVDTGDLSHLNISTLDLGLPKEELFNSIVAAITANRTSRIVV